MLLGIVFADGLVRLVAMGSLLNANVLVMFIRKQGMSIGSPFSYYLSVLLDSHPSAGLSPRGAISGLLYRSWAYGSGPASSRDVTFILDQARRVSCVAVS